MNNQVTILNQSQGFNVSNKYTPVPTQDLIDSLVANHGFEMTSSVKTRVRSASKEGFQKHMVRLAHKDMVLRNVNDSRPEIVIVNSYDGLSSLKVMLGIYRMICANGMIVGNTFEGYKVRHVGEIQDGIENALTKIAGQLPVIAEKINRFSGLMLTQAQQNDFAMEAAKLVLPANAENIRINSILRTRRYGDNGTSLWNVFNRVQEAALRGGIQYQTNKLVPYINHNPYVETKNNTTRAIKSIDRQVEVNQALWDLAEQVA